MQVADGGGRPWKSYDPLGHITETTYYPATDPRFGLVQTVSTPGNNAAATLTTTFDTYDEMGRLKGWTGPAQNNPSSQQSSFSSLYDAAGNLTFQGDGMSSAQHPLTQYKYDGLGRKTEIDYADATTEQWSYDKSGNLSQYTTRGGDIQTFAPYDMRNWPTGWTWSNPHNLPSSISFDAAGRCKTLSNTNSSLALNYDESSVLTSETQNVLGTGGKTVTYTPDADGNAISVLYPSGNTAYYGVLGSLDYLGRVQQLAAHFPDSTDSQDVLASYNYDRALLNGQYTFNNVQTDYGYQANDRIELVNHYHLHGTNISRRTYGYYPNGQMSWFSRTVDHGASGSRFENNIGEVYKYQGDGSLMQAYYRARTTPPVVNPSTGDSDPGTVTYSAWTEQFGYDAAGNRTLTEEGNSSPTALYTPTFDGENRETGPTYGLRGNVTGMSWDGKWFRYEYDALNQLVGGRSADGTEVASFVYDPLGRLCRRTINGVTTTLYYAGSQLIEERDALGSDVNCVYFYGASGERACRRDASKNTVTYLYDANGFTTHVVDSSGSVVEQYLYNAFGEPHVYDRTGTVSRGHTSTVTGENRFLWVQGYEWYPEIGLYRCGARFYSPARGRFMQPDPIGQAGGLNIYSYCHNDPINATDPSGLDDDGTGMLSFTSSGDSSLSFSEGTSDGYFSFNLSNSYFSYTGSGNAPAGTYNHNTFGGGMRDAGAGMLSSAQQIPQQVVQIAIPPYAIYVQAKRDMAMIEFLPTPGSFQKIGASIVAAATDPEQRHRFEGGLLLNVILFKGVGALEGLAAEALPAEIAETFSGGKYTSSVLQQPMTAYRYSGGVSGATGRFLTTADTVGQISSPAAASIALKLPVGATAETLNTFTISAGTRIFTGGVAGGADTATQIFIHDPGVLIGP